MSADPIDEANDLAMRENELAVANVLNRKNPLPHTGKCHNCDEPVSPEENFCDTDCRDDWEKRRKMKGGY